MRLFILRIVTVLILVLAPVIVHAEPEPEFSNGHALGHAYLRNRWAQVNLRLENPSDDGGHMKAILTSREGLKTIKYIRSFYLPANCERMVWFCGQLGVRQSNPVSIVNEAGAEVAEGDEMSNVLTPNRMLFLRLDEKEVLPSLAMYLGRRRTFKNDPGGGVASKGMMGALGGAVRRTATLSTRLPGFPDQWAGLDSMGAVAMGHLDYRDWRPKQVRALKTWIRSGGVLLLFPGKSYTTLRGSLLEDLLPVQIFGSRMQKKLEMKGESGSQTVELDEYKPLLESEVVDGETVISNGTMPIVVRKRVGMGSVYFFAVDGSVMDEWERSGSLYARILREQERLKPLAQTGLLEKGPQMLDAVAGAKVAPRSFVVAILGSFFVITALALGVAHYFRRTELAWGVIIPCGIVLGFISYRVGQSYRAEVGRSINEISVLSGGSGAKTMFRSAILGVHSEDTLRGELRAGTDDAFLTATSSKKKDKGTISTDSIQVNPRYVARNMTIQPGSMPRYVVDVPMQVDGDIKARFKLGPEGLEGTVENNLPFDLSDCLMVFNSYPFVVESLKSLPSGKKTQFSLNAKTARPRGDFTTEAILGSASLTRKRIVRHLFTSLKRHSYNPWTQRLFVLGWPQRDFIQEQLYGVGDKEVIKRSSAVLCVEAEVMPPEPGENVVIPRGFPIPALQPGRSDRAFRLSQYMGETMPPQAGLLFYIPSFASNVELSRGVLRMAVEAYGFNLTVLGEDQNNGNKVVLAEMKSPSGRKEIEIPRAGRFHNKEQGTLVLGLKAKMATDEDGKPVMGGRRMKSSWSMDSVSVKLEGQAR